MKASTELDDAASISEFPNHKTPLQAWPNGAWLPHATMRLLYLALLNLGLDNACSPRFRCTLKSIVPGQQEFIFTLAMVLEQTWTNNHFEIFFYYGTRIRYADQRIAVSIYGTISYPVVCI